MWRGWEILRHFLSETENQSNLLLRINQKMRSAHVRFRVRVPNVCDLRQVVRWNGNQHSRGTEHICFYMSVKDFSSRVLEL